MIDVLDVPPVLWSAEDCERASTELVGVRRVIEAFDRWRHSTGERRAMGADFDPFASFDWEHLIGERSALEVAQRG